MSRQVLKQARKGKKMTQQAMADYLGIGFRHYQKIEDGQLRGSFEVWDALEDYLGIHQRKLRWTIGIHHARAFDTCSPSCSTRNPQNKGVSLVFLPKYT